MSLPLLLLLAASEDPAALAAKVDAGQIRSTIEILSGARPSGEITIRSRHVGHPDLARAADFLVERLTSYGLEVERLPVAAPGLPDGLENIEATLAGTGTVSAVYVLGAHYDSTADGDPEFVFARDPAPGADDDASGCGLVLEAARVLSTVRPIASIRFVFFTAEEEGLVGSAAYARTASAALAPLRLVLSVDPVGNTAGTFHGNLFLTFDPSSEADANALVRSAEAAGVTLPITAVPGDGGLFADERSDHVSFWRRGFRALHVGTLPGPDYHSGGDLAAKVDVAFVAEAGRAVVAHLARSARLTPPPPPPPVESCSASKGSSALSLLLALVGWRLRRGSRST